MKIIHGLIDESRARSIAGLLTIVCYFVVLFFAAGMVLSLMGRQTFTLHTPTGMHHGAIFAETEDYWATGLTVRTHAEVRIIANSPQEIDSIINLGLFALFAVNAVPGIFAFWFLARVFRNVSKGDIFSNQNAHYLLYYGLIQMVTALAAPFIMVFIASVVSHFADSMMMITAGQNIFERFIPNVAFIVLAYAVQQGVHTKSD